MEVRMSRQNQKIFQIFLALFGAVLCIFMVLIIIPNFLVSQIVGDGTPSPPDPLEVKLNNLASRYKNGEISVIDISTITTFSWDRLYIFGDYTHPSDLDAVVGKSWGNNNNCDSQLFPVTYSDSYTLLVFSNKSIVVHCLAYVKSPYFLVVPEPQNRSGYSPQEALFVLDDRGKIVLKGSK
jgi:hypothetical protein